MMSTCLLGCTQNSSDSIPSERTASVVQKEEPREPPFTVTKLERVSLLRFLAKVEEGVNRCSGSALSEANKYGLKNEASNLIVSEGERCDTASSGMQKLSVPKLKDITVHQIALQLLEACQTAVLLQDEGNDYSAAELNDPDNSYKKSAASEELSKVYQAKGDCLAKKELFGERLGATKG